MAEARILLVEDDEDVLALLDMALGAEGYLVDTAVTVAQGMARLGEVRYSLVATDWRLPDGEGTLIADHAADLGYKTIIYSGYLFSIPAATARRHELLMKPMRPSEFVAAVRRSIGPARSG